MMKFLPWLIAGIVLTTVPASGRADYILSLSTSANPNHLLLGDSVTFDVSLSSGIDSSDPGTYLSYLAATVSYDNNLLSSNPLITSGASIPDTSSDPNIFGFFGQGFSNEADGLFEGDDFGSPPVIIPISQNGVFFSFQVTTTKVGSGTLSFVAFDEAATLSSDPNQNDQFTPETFDLPFTIVGGSGVTTPEPPTLVLFISSMCGLSVHAGLRRLARRLRLGQCAVTASTG